MYHGFEILTVKWINKLDYYARMMISVVYFYTNYSREISFTNWLHYNKSRLHGFKPLLCYAPFRNLYFNEEGNIAICCMNNQPIGKYPYLELNEVWFHKRLKIIRKQLRRNSFPAECKECKSLFDQGKFGLMFSRTFDRRGMKSRFNSPDSLALWLNNTCNLQCTMCSEGVSSSIRASKGLPQRVSPYQSEFLQKLTPLLRDLDSINLCGGEPFLIDIYYQILEKAVAINPEVRIHVITNGTVLNDRVKKILEMGNLDILVSVDSINKQRFESIRKNANYEIVMANLQYFYQYSLRRGTSLGISYAPQTSNWRDIKDILDFCARVDIGLSISTVTAPYALSLQSYGMDQLGEILQYYDSIKIPLKTGTQKKNYFSFLSFKATINQWFEFHRSGKVLISSRDEIRRQLDDCNSERIRHEASRDTFYRTIRSFFKTNLKLSSYENQLQMLDEEISSSGYEPQSAVFRLLAKTNPEQLLTVIKTDQGMSVRWSNNLSLFLDNLRIIAEELVTERRERLQYQVKLMKIKSFADHLSTQSIARDLAEYTLGGLSQDIPLEIRDSYLARYENYYNRIAQVYSRNEYLKVSMIKLKEMSSEDLAKEMDINSMDEVVIKFRTVLDHVKGILSD